MQFETRNEMIKALDISGEIAEIGVYRGDFSIELLKLNGVHKLHMIDIWENQVCSCGNVDGNYVVNYNGKDNYEYVLNRFKSYDRVEIHKMYSDTFFKQLKNKLDAVYIDGDHSYNGCKADLESARNAVKEGGWIMGHDYLINAKCNHFYDFGVNRAVNEFCEKYQLKISALGNDGCVSFAIKNV